MGEEDSGESAGEGDTRRRYARQRLHATGGFGQVWEARDSQLARPVALKELRPEHEGTPAARVRFLEEARITGQLEHPGIVPVYELIEDSDEAPYYTMRMVRGRTLSEAVRAFHAQTRQAGRPDRVALQGLLQAFVSVCNTLAYAHARGVVHRDLKGANVVLGPYGEVVVLDWGIARILGIGDDGMAEQPVAGAGLEPTQAGMVKGTLSHMAPEQAIQPAFYPPAIQPTKSFRFLW